MRTKPVNGNQPKRNLSKPKNAKMEWMKPQKTMRDGGEQHAKKNTTYQWEHEQESDIECKRECVREKLSETELWRNRAHKSENERGRQSVKVKTVKLEAPCRFWASNWHGAWPEIPNFNYDDPPRRLETQNRRGINPNFTQLFPQCTQCDHDVGCSPIIDVMVGHTTSVCSS